MSQNSLTLPTTGTVSGLQMTQYANNALDTLNTLASGASAPGSPEAGQLWHDTTNNLIKIYSLDATTWIPLFSLNETAYTGVPVAGGPLGQGIFLYSSSSVCTLGPYQGDKISFPNGSVATIPSGGVTTNCTSCYLNGTASQALTAGTTYYAYLWNAGSSSSPNYVIDWSTTGYATDATSGITVKSGDSTRVLVGAASILAGPVFANANQNRLVRSWFNDTGVQLGSTFSSSPSTTSTSPVELQSAIRCSFFKWARDHVIAGISGDANKSTSSGSVSTYINYDGSTSASLSTGQSASANVVFPIACIDNYIGSALAEGLHYATIFGGNNSAGTATYDQNCVLTVHAGP